jgi:hypothetical protein
MRARNIKPGIMSNEALAALGPYAYILFTGLWMIADRDGRLECRPKRIKALVMPLWDEISSTDVENLLEKLCESGFLARYIVGEQEYICIAKWREHQKPDPRERASTLPPPPTLTNPESNGYGDTVKLHRQHSGLTVSKRADSGLLIADSGGGDSGEEHTHLETPPPPPPQKRKPTRAPSVERKSPTRETRSRESGKPKAHDAADVELLRDSLNGLAGEIGMPPPDTALIERTLDAGNGASGAEIHAALVALFKRGKFQAMRSWGFVPLVIGDAFQCARLRTG